MIVVDTSVWIDFLNGRNAPHVRTLRAMLGANEVTVGDLMLREALQSLDSEAAARRVEALLRRFDVVPMAGDRDFRPMARHLGLMEVPAAT
jgi:predicted nucleic acid-binding protein